MPVWWHTRCSWGVPAGLARRPSMMTIRRLIVAAAFLMLVAPTALASSADSCYVSTSSGTYPAECIGSSGSHTAEDYSGGSTSNNCYGACGPGCSFNCGSGGACQTHDYYTRTEGILSWDAISNFPPALEQ